MIVRTITQVSIQAVEIVRVLLSACTDYFKLLNINTGVFVRLERRLKTFELRCVQIKAHNAYESGNTEQYLANSAREALLSAELRKI